MDRLRRILPPSVRRVARVVLRRLRPARGVEHARGDPSSFGTVIDERLAWLHAHLPPEIARFQAGTYTKEGQRRLGERLGLPMPEVYLMNVPLAEALAFASERGLERFVVKPVSSHNAIGLRALVASGGGYLDLRTCQRRSLQGHRRILEREYGRLGRPDAWLVEELLLPVDGTVRAIDDYKFLCFGGRTELILVTRPHPRRRGERIKRFYDRVWMPVNVGFFDHERPSFAAPCNGRKLMAFAEGAAARLAYPFIRIDTFDSTRGILLGELTPGPGGRHRFNDHWNDYLLRRWREAADQLIEGMRSGTIELLGPKPEPAAG